MKKVFLLFLAVMVLPVFSYRAEAAGLVGPSITKEFNLKDFNGINVSSFYEVTLIKDNRCKVTVECDKDLEKYLKVSVSNGVLHLGLDKIPQSLQRKDRHILKATVHMPSLTYLKMSGATSLESEGRFEGRERFSLDMSGASKASGLSIYADRADIEMSGASKCKDFAGRFGKVGLSASGAAKLELDIDADVWNVGMSGAVKADLKGGHTRSIRMESSGAVNTNLGISSDNLTYEGSGASKLNAQGAPASRVNVEISGSSKCRVDVLEYLEVEASGASECLYKAPKNATVKTNNPGRLTTVQAI
ncbi:MAG: DUF2807 domain-containing protein [Bacteroidales bacterium]|nr:DUF2807 domain-containing protein [Bacteroidales bacterium]